MKTAMFGIVVCALGFGASAGEISKRTYSRYFEWESTECYKPTAPYIYKLDQYTRWEAENYVDEVEQYISCVEAEAQNDFFDAKRKLADAIEEGRDEAIADVQNDLDSFIRDLPG